MKKNICTRLWEGL